jgi:hypothetical protein
MGRSISSLPSAFPCFLAHVDAVPLRFPSWLCPFVPEIVLFVTNFPRLLNIYIQHFLEYRFCLPFGRHVSSYSALRVMLVGVL